MSLRSLCKREPHLSDIGTGIAGIGGGVFTIISGFVDANPARVSSGTLTIIECIPYALRGILYEFGLGKPSSSIDPQDRGNKFVYFIKNLHRPGMLMMEYTTEFASMASIGIVLLRIVAGFASAGGIRPLEITSGVISLLGSLSAFIREPAESAPEGNPRSFRHLLQNLKKHPRLLSSCFYYPSLAIYTFSGAKAGDWFVFCAGLCLLGSTLFYGWGSLRRDNEETTHTQARRQFYQRLIQRKTS